MTRVTVNGQEYDGWLLSPVASSGTYHLPQTDDAKKVPPPRFATVCGRRTCVAVVLSGLIANSDRHPCQRCFPKGR